MSKYCQVCGYEYIDGADINTIMAHIQDTHMND